MFGGSNTFAISNLTISNGVAFFTTGTSATGNELWKSDGTVAGTVPVKDINPGAASSAPSNLTDVNGTLYFSANTAANGIELWKSDGTDTGTVLVRDINPGAGSSSPQELTNLNGALLFTMRTAAARELWKSDGTEAGTVLVKVLNPGSANLLLGPLVILKGAAFFDAFDPTTGIELWKSDGTADGTVLVKDINPGADSSSPVFLTHVNGTLFFGATEPSTGFELWKSDGTAAGTVLVKDTFPGPPGGLGRGLGRLLTNVNGTLYFSGAGGVWKSDGTASGTLLISALATSFSSGPLFLTNVNGWVYFVASTRATGYELWKSDGTNADTALVADIFPGGGSAFPGGGGSPVPFRDPELTNINGTVFFAATDGVTGIELWKTDGTAAGTVLVKDINPGAANSGPTNLTNINGTLFFSASTASAGTELWKSDGTADGTVMVKDINPGTSNATPSNLTNVTGTLFFSAFTPSTGTELWKSDGTAAGTLMVKDISPGAGGSSARSFINFNDTLFFTATRPDVGFELWKSDGTDTGTVLVKDTIAGASAGLARPPHFTIVNGALFFTAAHYGIPSDKLWKSDGTEAGTVEVIDLFPGVPGFEGVNDTTPMSLTAFNGKLLFNGFNGLNGNELWISDGTAAGTLLVKDIYPGLLGSIYPGNSAIIALSRSAALAASDGFTGLELWKTNGEGVGTILVQDILPGPGSSTPQQFVQSANQVFFTAFDVANRHGLWVVPLAALDVSLEEQIDQLLLLLNAPEIQDLKLPASLNAQLTSARGEVSSDNVPGQFVVARSHLENFDKILQNQVHRGNITASQAQPLLGGANAILQQIEGNHPPKHSSDHNDENQ